MSNIESVWNTEGKKFCRDCKHVRAEELHTVTIRYGYQAETNVRYECLHPINIEYDLVSGKTYPIHKIADVRKPRGKCKPEGLMFEPK